MCVSLLDFVNRLVVFCVNIVLVNSAERGFFKDVTIFYFESEIETNESSSFSFYYCKCSL